MQENLPKGSEIRLDRLNGYDVIELPLSDLDKSIHVLGYFLLAFIALWLIGFYSSLSNYFSSSCTSSLFLLVWLFFWTLGGAVFVGFTYRVFSETSPEKLLLNMPSLSIDTGNSFERVFSSGQAESFNVKTFFSKSRIIEFTPNDIKSIKLRQLKNGARLTIDKGIDRFSIGYGLTEIEKEWLYKYLKRRYLF